MPKVSIDLFLVCPCSSGGKGFQICLSFSFYGYLHSAALMFLKLSIKFGCISICLVLLDTSQFEWISYVQCRLFKSTVNFTCQCLMFSKWEWLRVEWPPVKGLPYLLKKWTVCELNGSEVLLRGITRLLGCGEGEPCISVLKWRGCNILYDLMYLKK